LIRYGTWSPYPGNGAFLLAVTLLIIAGVFVFLGTRLHRPAGVAKPGRTVGIFLMVIWFLSLATFAIAVGTYVSALYEQVGPVTLPTSPISPVTDLSILVAFIMIAYLSRHHGLMTALGSAIVGTVAAPLIFELPFDLIVMGRTYPPTPATAVHVALFPASISPGDCIFLATDIVTFNEIIEVHPVLPGSHVLCIRNLGFVCLLLSFLPNTICL